ncbi:leucine-rich repeat-containing protein 27-like isoform X2 [Mobula hypostoma]|uniref:leucine-rich repeat-containing protein 27-like isoform X2 n=1 Tax=Mobula hypostoma TaxID=723540 RepID=UPI002FC2908C
MGSEGAAVSSSTGSSSVGEMVDLAGRGLKQVPEHVLERTGLEYLYLEGNVISELSEDFFHRLPHLIWLDLRNNKLTSLPLSIGDHRCLKTLLLEGNPIRKLPVELEMPVIEKLQLNARTESSLDFSNEKERQRFKILKQKLAQEERREGFLQSRKDWGAGFVSTVPSILRKEGSNPNTIFPASKAYDVSIQAKRKEELKLAALKELKEKQAIIEQRKLDYKVLKNWRDKAQLLQEKKEKERIQRSPHLSEKNMIVKNAPFATDPNYYHTVRVIDAKKTPVHKNNQKVDFEKEIKELRAVKDRDLQLRIQQHIELMQARRKQPKGTPQEELEAAKRELEVAVNLKSELARRKIIDNPL